MLDKKKFEKLYADIKKTTTMNDLSVCRPTDRLIKNIDFYHKILNKEKFYDNFGNTDVDIINALALCKNDSYMVTAFIKNPNTPSIILEKAIENMFGNEIDRRLMVDIFSVLLCRKLSSSELEHYLLKENILDSFANIDLMNLFDKHINSPCIPQSNINTIAEYIVDNRFSTDYKCLPALNLFLSFCDDIEFLECSLNSENLDEEKTAYYLLNRNLSIDTKKEVLQGNITFDCQPANVLVLDDNPDNLDKFNLYELIDDEVVPEIYEQLSSAVFDELYTDKVYTNNDVETDKLIAYNKIYNSLLDMNSAGKLNNGMQFDYAQRLLSKSPQYIKEDLLILDIIENSKSKELLSFCFKEPLLQRKELYSNKHLDSSIQNRLVDKWLKWLSKQIDKASEKGKDVPSEAYNLVNNLMLIDMLPSRMNDLINLLYRNKPENERVVSSLRLHIVPYPYFQLPMLVSITDFLEEKYKKTEGRVLLVTPYVAKGIMIAKLNKELSKLNIGIEAKKYILSFVLDNVASTNSLAIHYSDYSTLTRQTLLEHKNSIRNITDFENKYNDIQKVLKNLINECDVLIRKDSMSYSSPKVQLQNLSVLLEHFYENDHKNKIDYADKTKAFIDFEKLNTVYNAIASVSKGDFHERIKTLVEKYDELLEAEYNLKAKDKEELIKEEKSR